MLKFYIVRKKSLQIIPVDEVAENLASVVWIDLFQPTPEEEKFTEQLLGIGIPTREEMHEIELSSRLYQENGALYTTATIIAKADTNEPENHAVTFVLANKCLITIRYAEPQPFRFFLARYGQISEGNYEGKMVFANLLNAINDRLADILEKIGHNIDGMTKTIFRPASVGEDRKYTKPDLEEILRNIGTNGDLISKTRESLISVMRVIGFISKTHYFKTESEEHRHLITIHSDIVALSDHANFLSGKLNFLLDATLGMISIEQNAIIKIFSVAAVVFLPPTLVASIYGMNFDFMPELKWHLGYLFAIVMMICSALLPYFFFRKKGWL